MEENEIMAIVDEAWDDDAPDTTDESEEVEEEIVEEENEPVKADDADESTGETEQAEEEEVSEPETETSEEEETFDITYLGNKETYTREQMTELAQKGRNYDHITDKLKSAEDELESYRDFFKALDPDHSVEEVMDNALARIKADKEGIDISVAQQKVKLDRQQKNFDKSQRVEREKAEADEARQASFRRFAESHPDVKPNEIPREVWDRVAKGEDISNAYGTYENRQLKDRLEKLEKELAAEKQNSKNSSRSTGSSKSAGNYSKKSSFEKELDDIWND